MEQKRYSFPSRIGGKALLQRNRGLKTFKINLQGDSGVNLHENNESFDVPIISGI